MENWGFPEKQYFQFQNNIITINNEPKLQRVDFYMNYITRSQLWHYQQLRAKFNTMNNYRFCQKKLTKEAAHIIYWIIEMISKYCFDLKSVLLKVITIAFPYLFLHSNGFHYSNCFLDSFFNKSFSVLPKISGDWKTHTRISRGASENQ